MIEASVPDDDTSRAVIVLRDQPLEILVLERMILNQDCQSL